MRAKQRMLKQKDSIPYLRPIVNLEPNYNFEKVLRENKYESGSCSVKVLNILKKVTNHAQILLTHSCTAALELSALLLGIQPGDEIIMPSFTFVSTANAFILRGAIPIFVDIDPSTMNINSDLIESKITKKTKAIVPVHYAGASCSMEAILFLARKYNLFVVEDAAQCIGAYYKNKHLGTIGDLGALSFHYTKNISSGFGGALFVKSPLLFEKAKVIYQRGTNREAFLEGEVDKYTWKETGSSFVMPELSAAFLLSNIEKLEEINLFRKNIFDSYHEGFEELEIQGFVKRPHINSDIYHNAHIYYLILNDSIKRIEFLNYMKFKGIQAVSHYEPLHLSNYYKEHFDPIHLPFTEKIAKQLVRLPLYETLSPDNQNTIMKTVIEFFINK